MDVTLRRLVGCEVLEHLSDAARLRIAVFREFPYLYEGGEEDERDYLATYARCSRSVLILAEADSVVIGVSTGLPLVDADPDFREPFCRVGENVEDWFYCGESVLDPRWRGRGIGRLFFDHRESHARELGLRKVCFCAVERPDNHPLKPEGYRPNDPFWERRGYRKRADLRCRFAWRQVDSAGQQVENDLVFRTRELPPQM